MSRPPACGILPHSGRPAKATCEFARGIVLVRFGPKGAGEDDPAGEFGMNRVDAVILLILALYGFTGFRRGFLAVALDWLGLAAAVGVALWLYPAAGRWLSARYGLIPALSRILGFLVLLLATRLLWAVMVGLIWRRIPRVLRRSKVDRIAGILPGLLQGTVVVSLGLIALAALPLPIVPHPEIARSPLGSALLAWGTTAQASVQRWMGNTVRDLITFHALPVKEGERVDLPFKTAQPASDPEAEAAMLHLLNAERRQRGLPPLHLNERLRHLAREHSQDMLAQGYFAHDDPEGHTPFDRMRAAGIPFHAAGENLAFAPTVEVAHSGLMNSPGHRANILNRAYHRVGIGALHAPPFGIMFSQEFTN
jgi:uncharacterized protein YkwD/uncharacterized membrane protein required for colicin V production